MKKSFKLKKDSDNIYNQHAVTKEYVNNFILEIKKEDSFANDLVKEIYAVDDKWKVDKVQDGSATLKSSSHKTIKISESDPMRNYYRGRFIPVSFTAKEINKETTRQIFMDRKQNGLSQISTQTFLVHLNECIYIGKITDIIYILGLGSEIDEREMLFQQYMNYHILKKEFNLTDKELFDIVIDLFEDDDLNNSFVGLLDSSYKLELNFDKENEILLENLKECCSFEENYINPESVQYIDKIIKLLKLEKSIYMLDKEGDLDLDRFVLKKKEGKTLFTIVSTHIESNIERYIESVSMLYDINHALDILVDIMHRHYKNFIYEEIAYYIEDFYS